MTNFRKIGPNEWGLESDTELESGSHATVTLKSGATKQVTVGAYVTDQYGKHVYRIVAEPRAPRATTAVGDMAGVIELFNKAKQHLKYPTIVLSVPAIGETIKVNMAGAKAKVPGSLNVVSATQERDTNWGRKPLWYGRVSAAGQFEQANAAPAAIAERLTEFACDPVKVAGEHGRLTGRCCFCNLPLKDERSTAVGYGSTCAAHYDLPWGKRPNAVGEAA